MGNVKKIVAPIVGMTFFWAYFRYQAVFGTLYPLGSEVSVFGYGIQLYTVFLIEALVLSVIALFFFKKSGGCYSLGKRVVLASSIIGTMGAVLNMCVQAGVFDAVVFWLSILLTVIGFLGNYLAWAQYFSSSFGAKHLVLLAISYFMSIVLLTALSLSFASMKPLLTTMTPLIVGLSWCLAQPQGRIPKQKRSKPSGSKKWINQTTTLYIGLYIAFLLAGSVVRGIIDTGYSSESVPYLRWVISIGVSGLILAACVWYWFKTKHGIDGNGEGFEASVDGEKNEHRSTDPCLLDGFGVAFLFGHVCVAHIWLVCGGRPYRSRRPIIARLLFMGAALRYRHEGKDPSRTTVSCLRYFDRSGVVARQLRNGARGSGLFPG